jgi:hypothetical protein
MSTNSLYRELTRPEKIELEKALRQLLYNGSLSREHYNDVLASFGFKNVGTALQFEGLYGEVFSMEIDAEEVKLAKGMSYAH